MARKLRSYHYDDGFADGSHREFLLALVARGDLTEFPGEPDPRTIFGTAPPPAPEPLFDPAVSPPVSERRRRGLILTPMGYLRW